MNPLIQFKTVIVSLLIALALACFALSPPIALAVTPPPDGGYANLNTAEGDFALFSLTTGTENTALGFQALYSDTDGSLNTATGRFALLTNTEGSENTAVGASALKLNTTGSQNVALGRSALFENTTGSFNNALGYNAMSSNTSGYENTAIGDCGLMANTIGHDNQSLGEGALINNTSGNYNVAAGSFALANNTTGELNVGLGFEAGFEAVELTTGNNNIDIANHGVAGESNTIRIGRPVAVTAVGPVAFTLPAHTATYIAGIYNTTIANGLVVKVDSTGHLGTVGSSERFKDAIKPMDKTSESILALKPVTFRYKHELDPEGVPQFGLIAEQVEKVNPDLVVRDAEGKVYSVRYDAVNAMLLNEFLKEHKAALEEHRKVEKLEATVAGLVATMKEQASQIQKMSAQLELSKPAPQIVRNNQ
jgi:Chaperone of endosialidase